MPHTWIVVNRYVVACVVLPSGIRRTNGRAVVGMMIRPGRKVPCAYDRG